MRALCIARGHSTAAIHRTCSVFTGCRVAFFGELAWVIPTVAFINVWRHMGYTVLLVFAGLQTINKSVDEATDIDGVGEGRKFFSITLPLLRPVLAMILVVTVIGAFQIFDTVSVTTQGGPVNAT